MSRLQESAAILKAAERWKQRCLIEGGSLFGEERLWTEEYFRELKSLYSETLDDTSGRSFWVKLHDQLAPARPEAKRLFAEMVWVYYLVAQSLRAETKARNIKEVYEWSNRSLPEGHWALGEILSKGTVITGPAFNQYMWKEFVVIIALMLSWCSASRKKKRDLLNDPWTFTGWIYESEDTNARSFPHALRYLLFPDHFECILSQKMKKEILRSFGAQFGEDWDVRRMDWTEIDQALLTIRKRLEKEHPGKEVSFYRSPWQEIWHISTIRPPHLPENAVVEEEVETYDESAPPYGVDDALKDLFMEERQFRRIVDSLREAKNAILQGPPGVGKTFVARRIAYCLMQCKDESTLEMTQFHQSYAYEDFVQGWRPNAEGRFSLRDGVFYEFCQRAEKSPSKPFVFIIDEINRGNLSKIFGELLMLIEADKRGPKHAISLTYSDRGERFSVPENMHVLGLMNTADRSLAIVDYALRRRFVFETLAPAFGSAHGRKRFRKFLRNKGVAPGLIKRIVAEFKKLNEAIGRDSDLGPGFAIGHSYFVPPEDFGGSFDEGWRLRIVDMQIAPLLREYWFDNTERANKHITALSQ